MIRRSLIDAEGRIDRRAVMADAWRDMADVRRRGRDAPGVDQWDWPRVLRFAHARARGEKNLRAMDTIGAMVRAMVEEREPRL
jgi:hypothetical protein